MKKIYLLSSLGICEYASLSVCRIFYTHVYMYILYMHVYVYIYIYIYAESLPFGVAHVDDLHSIFVCIYVCVIHVCIYVCIDICISRNSTFWDRTCR